MLGSDIVIKYDLNDLNVGESSFNEYIASDKYGKRLLNAWIDNRSLGNIKDFKNLLDLLEYKAMENQTSIDNANSVKLTVKQDNFFWKIYQNEKLHTQFAKKWIIDNNQEIVSIVNSEEYGEALVEHYQSISLLGMDKTKINFKKVLELAKAKLKVNKKIYFDLKAEREDGWWKLYKTIDSELPRV